MVLSVRCGEIFTVRSQFSLHTVQPRVLCWPGGEHVLLNLPCRHLLYPIHFNHQLLASLLGLERCRKRNLRKLIVHSVQPRDVFSFQRDIWIVRQLPPLHLL